MPQAACDNDIARNRTLSATEPLVKEDLETTELVVVPSAAIDARIVPRPLLRLLSSTVTDSAEQFKLTLDVRDSPSFISIRNPPGD